MKCRVEILIPSPFVCPLSGEKEEEREVALLT
jgi:hypothetical protein